MRADDANHPFVDLVEGEEVAQSNSGEAALVEAQVAAMVADDMAIDAVLTPKSPATEGLVVVRGRLQKPSGTLFPYWLGVLNERGYTPFLEQDEPAVTPMTRLTADEPLAAQTGLPVKLRVFRGVSLRTPGNPMLNLALYGVTWITTLYVGASYVVDPSTVASGWAWLSPQVLVQGMPFALTLLSILTAHELGHYFMARRHNVAVSLPYFIPMPIMYGTMGAFIVMRQAISDRKRLFDIGIAGPLAGLVLAIPLLIYGLSTSELTTLPSLSGIMMEGNSILYLAAKYLIFGLVLPNFATGQDVLMNPITFGAWIGLLVTALNLIPVGQLDGGHIAYALLGKRARYVNIGAMVVMFVLGLAGLPWLQDIFPWLAEVGSVGWFFWLLLIYLLMGPFHPAPLDDVTKVSWSRVALGCLTFVLFILILPPATMRVIP